MAWICRERLPEYLPVVMPQLMLWFSYSASVLQFVLPEKAVVCKAISDLWTVAEEEKKKKDPKLLWV